MVEYSRSHIKQVDTDFNIETFSQKKKVPKKEKFRLIDVMDLGMYLLVPLLVGLAAGIWLDNKMEIKPIGTITGLVLGAFGSLFNLIKIVREFSQNA